MAWLGGVGECAFWVTETVWEIVPKVGEGKKGGGKGRGRKRGWRGVTGMFWRRGLGDESEVVKGEDGRVGVRMVAFVGVGWK